MLSAAGSRRRLVAATLLAASAWAGCSAAGPPALSGVDAGAGFALRAGASAQAGDGGLRVGFDGVSADSRCPKGERCVWAGDATVRVWVQRGAEPKLRHELHTTPGATQAVRLLGHELRLLLLDPYPLAGQPIAAADYRATLTLRPAPASASER